MILGADGNGGAKGSQYQIGEYSKEFKRGREVIIKK